MNGDAPPPSGRGGRPPAPRPAAGTPPPPVIPHAVPAPPPPQFLPPSALPRPLDLAAQPLPGTAVARSRSRLLAASLFLKGTGAVLGVCFGTIGYFAMSSADPNTILDHRPVAAIKNAMLAMTLISALQLIGVLGTLAWKRWAVYVLVTLGTLNLLVAFKAEAPANALYDLLALAVFGVALSRHWRDFE